MKNKKAVDFFVISLILIICIAGYFIVKDEGLMYDEKYHYQQIKNFIDGDFSIIPRITMIPGYHAVMAVVGFVFGVYSLASIRLFSLFFSIFSIFVFFKLSKKISREGYRIKTLLYFFSLVFLFFFLVHTDIFSLLLLLLCFYFILNKKYNLAGLFGVLSLFVRQNNVVWLAFMAAIVYFEKYNLKFSIKILKEWARECWVFLVGFVLFIIFVIINKGFAIGGKEMHPAFSFHLENVAYFLFLFFVFFLPLNISNLPKIIKLLKKNKRIIILLFLLFILYFITFVNDHPNNQPESITGNILRYPISGSIQKIISFIPLAYALLSLLVTKLRRKSFYLLYPFTVLFLTPAWYVDHRYYFIPFTFFILFKKEKSKFVEYSTLIIFIAAALFLFYRSLWLL